MPLRELVSQYVFASLLTVETPKVGGALYGMVFAGGDLIVLVCVVRVRLVIGIGFCVKVITYGEGFPVAPGGGFARLPSDDWVARVSVKSDVCQHFLLQVEDRLMHTPTILLLALCIWP